MATLLVSCFKEKLVAPRADYLYYVLRNTDTIFTPDTVEVGEVVYFRNTGSGDYFSVYPGEAESDYNMQTNVEPVESNVVGLKGNGLPLRRAGLYSSATYKYKQQGNYEIVYISTSVANYANDSEQDVKRGQFISVSDRQTKISNITATIGAAQRDIKPKEQGDTVLLPVRYGTTDKIVTIRFQAGNATVTRGGVAVARDGIAFRDRNVDASQPIVYDVLAADGVTRRKVVFMLVEGAKTISENNALNAIAVSGVKFLPTETNMFSLLYPHGKTETLVTLDMDDFATAKINGKEFKKKDKVYISDLLSGAGGTIEIVSESLVANLYKYLIQEEKVVAQPFSFSQASGFPVVKGAGDTLNIYLSSSLDFTKLVPVFAESKFTRITYGAEMKSFVNGVDTVDFSSPVRFIHANGIDTVIQVLVVKAL